MALEAKRDRVKVACLARAVSVMDAMMDLHRPACADKARQLRHLCHMALCAGFVPFGFGAQGGLAGDRAAL